MYKIFLLLNASILIFIGCGNVSTKLHHIPSILNINNNVDDLVGSLTTIQGMYEYMFPYWPEYPKFTESMFSNQPLDARIFHQNNYRNYTMPNLSLIK